MPDKIYQGKNIRLTLAGKKVFHATDCGISATLNLEALASKDTDGDLQSPGSLSWSMSLSALVAEKDPVSLTHHSFKDVVRTFLNKVPVDIQYTTAETGDWVFSGSAYITQFDISAQTAGAATGSFSFTGNGDLTLDDID
jgi:predicted secreted protein